VIEVNIYEEKMGDYDSAAKRLIEMAKSMPNFPKAQIVLVKWRQEEFFGSIQQIYPQFLDVFYLSKTSKPVAPELVDSIRRIEASILELIADDRLDLEGRGHLLRRVDGGLTYMTPEQTKYAVKNPPDVTELNR
jgi:hypothetical protein